MTLWEHKWYGHKYEACLDPNLPENFKVFESFESKKFGNLATTISVGEKVSVTLYQNENANGPSGDGKAQTWSGYGGVISETLNNKGNSLKVTALEKSACLYE